MESFIYLDYLRYVIPEIEPLYCSIDNYKNSKIYSIFSLKYESDVQFLNLKFQEKFYYIYCKVEKDKDIYNTLIINIYTENYKILYFEKKKNL